MSFSPPEPDVSACLDETVEAVRERLTEPPSVGVVLGTGLGGFVTRARNLVSVPSSDLPHMVTPRTAQNEGTLCLGVVDDVPIVCLRGRPHLYEGHPAWKVVLGVRLMARLGVRAILLTDACWSLEPSWTPGTMMVVTDHLDFAFGRAPSGSSGIPKTIVSPYDASLVQELHEAVRSEALLAARIGHSAKISLQEGVYAGVEDTAGMTPAQMHMFRALGASVVGMGLVPEVAALSEHAVRVAALTYVAGASADEATSRSFERVLRAWVLRAHRLEA
jgi:purine-nucleoside phosphorylase